ncbi:MAG TPA: hypothetical protein VMR45_00555 [Patescibacteria group bacterium]|nr:hypothetical protein [Patescibacteria group bacterium]
MKRNIGTIVLFVLLIMTVVALRQISNSHTSALQSDNKPLVGAHGTQ